MIIKRCYKCKNTLKAENFHKSKRFSDGLTDICKDCKQTQDREYSERNKEKLAIKAKEYRETHKKQIALRDKTYRERNKDKLASQSKSYREQNKEKLAERKKQRYNSATSEEVAERKRKKREYNKNVPEHVKQRKQEYDKAYFASNRGKNVIKNSSHRRRAQILSSYDNTITLDALDVLAKNQDYKCKWCNNPLDYSTPKQIHLDHIIPLSRGGKHSINNVCWSCAHCNLTKNNKLPEEFIIDQLSISD